MKKKITWLQKFDNNHRDSVWYAGDVVEIETERYTFVVSAVGEEVFYIDGERYKGEYLAPRLRESGIENDKQLYEAIKSNKLEYLSNNWFDLIIWDKKSKDYIDYYDTVDLEDENFDWINNAFIKSLS